ncbi:peroxisomal membrane protein PMP34-like isoform X2 [Stegostoma tigrinum]|uniref:peroxisomal membrane protein PMP34-like isoform X2 n=1 Tax=Stegostoma tigrinum TaxID=3053191 RepID=UPI00287013D7|nr:peroxisomal membrane protein PMP34-like isoform X2 [Stegostoma tigrinum]
MLLPEAVANQEARTLGVSIVPAGAGCERRVPREGHFLLGQGMKGSPGLPAGPAFSYEGLVHAVAGAAGGATAMTLFYPLDTARLRLQVDEKVKSRSACAVLATIVKEEGLLAVYRSWFPVISSLCCSNFVYFYTFNALKDAWVKGQPSTNGKDLVMGFISDAISRIVREEGILALWSSTFPSLLLVFNPAIQFMFYEGLKRQLMRGRTELLSLEVFIIGAISKAIATTVTYPLQTVQSLLRFGQQKVDSEGRIVGSLRRVVYILRQRMRKQGLWGLYKGLEAKLLQTILTSALMFLVYEKIAGIIFRLMGVNPRVGN